MELCPDQKRAKARRDFAKYMMRHGASPMESRGASLALDKLFTQTAKFAEKLHKEKGIPYDEAVLEITKKLFETE